MPGSLVKKIYNKAKSAAKKRYTTKTGGVRIKQVVKDVTMLKNLINVEKKRYTLSTAIQPVGQLSGATGAGYFVTDITPIPAQGTTSVTRTGNSIKLVSSYMQFQFYHQSSTQSQYKVRIQFFLINGAPIPSAGLAATFNSYYTLNPFVLNAGSPAIVDMNSSFNPDYFGQFKVLRTKTFTVPPDQLSSAMVMKTVKIPHRWFRKKGHHIRFQADGSTLPSNGQILMSVFVEAGNSNTTIASTLTGTSIQNAATGLNMDYNILHYFVDN